MSKKSNRKRPQKIRSGQVDLIPKGKNKWVHGESQARGHARIARPFLPNKWIHVCLKSTQAKGPLSFLLPANQIKVRNLLKKLRTKYFIEIHDFVNMGNHLHLKVKSKQKKNLQNFFRVFAALLARMITGAVKGKPFGRFWEGLVFSRVLVSAIEILYLQGYFQANRVERQFGKLARDRYLEKFRDWVRLKTFNSAN